MVTAADLNKVFLQLPKRAELNEPSKLVETFVDTGNLFTLLSSVDHQVLYGRRGTGKTHALLYLIEKVGKQGDIAIYIDMRTIGSTGGIYADPSLPLPERGTRLLSDTLSAVHEQLLRSVLDRQDLDLSRLGPVLDRLASEATEVVVTGTVDREQTIGASTLENRLAEGTASFGGEGAELKVGINNSRSASTRSDLKMTETGALRHRIHFGAVGKVLKDLVDQLDGKRLWIILDEWSSVPLDLQPYLADLVRRSFFPVRGISIKIGAIEQRSHFKLPTEAGDYVGIELGADVSADLNLDDFMVFGNDAARAKTFFRELLFRHARSLLAGTVLGEFETASQLQQIAFTQRNAIDEFARAAEGVPRDAINIVAIAALKAGASPLSVQHIRGAAKTWYQRDKERAVGANTPSHRLLNWIIDEVIGHRRARAFLLQSDVDHPLIDALFDARVLHVLKRTVSAKDRPGIRFAVYALDFGCYVDLITTARAPESLLLIKIDGKEERIEEVPADDYRSIRGAVLELEQFEKSLRESVAPTVWNDKG